MLQSKSSVRAPAVAGTFYPGESRELAQVVTQLLDAAAPRSGRSAPKALLSPQAGDV
jgi:AmmeMemoRadiSam system protein B